MVKIILARVLLQGFLRVGFEQLCENNPAYNFMGYEQLALIWMHVGDDMNALSALSLCGRYERYRDDHKVIHACAGGCGRQLSREDSLHFCKVCDDARFEDECLEQLQDGTLKRGTCSADHEWLRAPSWRDEFQETGKHHVYMRGKLE